MADTDISNNVTIHIDKTDFVVFLENKLDIDIGFYFWKKYVASAVWSNLSTPINLIITLLTALSTAQTTSKNIISDNLAVDISIATLVITVINTFFRPHFQMTQNIDYMKKWSALGNDFEEIYYSEEKYTTNIETIIDKYRELQTRVNQLKETEGPDTTNFFTDLIHIICNITCLKKYQRWLDMNKQIMQNYNNN
jgi:hypothetical protein